MHDRDDGEPEQDAPKTTQDILGELETVTFHLNSLYQRLSQDRDSWAVTGGDLAQVVGELRQRIKEFGGIKDKLQQQVAKSLLQEGRHAAMIASEGVKKAAKEVLENDIGYATARLSNVVDLAHGILIRYERDVSHVRIWYFVLILFGALLGGAMGAAIVIHIYFADNPVTVQKAPQQQEEVRKPKAARGD